ncbi:MAG: sulfatase-like hydrolase/transferase [Chloroflexota bacterium]
MSRPNILWICTDQQRSDSLGCAGNPIVRTPNIDSIAAGGTRFTRHITPMQMCSPSRACMATGLYQRNHQLITNGRFLPESIPTVMSMLSEAGYRTHGVGKQHLQPLLAAAERKMPDSRAFWNLPEAKTWRGPYYGFQTMDMLLGESDTAHLAGHYAAWLKENHPESYNLLEPEQAKESPNAELDEIWRSAMPAELHYNSWITDRATEFIADAAQQAEPFFLYVSYPDPHHPFDPPEPYADRYNPADMPLPEVTDADRNGRPPYCNELYPTDQGFRDLYWAADDAIEAGVLYPTEHLSRETLQTAVAYTYSMIEMIDDGVGDLLAALQAHGLDDNTIILFTSDHGDYLCDHGLLHKGPAPYRQITEVPLLVRGPGIKNEQTVSSLTSHIDLAPTLLELAGIEHDAAQFDGLSLVSLLAGGETAVRDHTFGEYHPTVHTDLYNQTVYKGQWRYTIYPYLPNWGELFDLENDPTERVNLYFDDAYATIREELSNLLANEYPPQPTVENPMICKW